MDHDPTEGRGKPAAQITTDDMMGRASVLVRLGVTEGARYLMVAAQRLKRLETIAREETSDELGQLLRIRDELGIPRPPRHESPIQESDEEPEPPAEPIPTDPEEAKGWRANKQGVSFGESLRPGQRTEGWERGHRARSEWVKAGRPQQ